MGKSTLSYINENLKTYYFACSLLASLASISGMFMNFKSFMAWTGTILVLVLFFFSTKFLVVGHKSKQTKHERALIYKDGYDQGRFDEDIERTYPEVKKMVKDFAKENGMEYLFNFKESFKAVDENGENPKS